MHGRSRRQPTGAEQRATSITGISLAGAEATLAAFLRDEPDFDGALWVEAVEFEQGVN
jgi:hypothetical protein